MGVASGAERKKGLVFTVTGVLNVIYLTNKEWDIRNH